MHRRLSLTREDLCDLTPDELSSFAGAGMEDTVVCTPPRPNPPGERLLEAIRTTVRTITCWC